MSVLTCLHRPVGWWWGDLRCKTPTYECPVAHSAGAVEYSYCCNILTPTLMAISVVSFSFSRAAQPEA